jgi:hypothetical protein
MVIRGLSLGSVLLLLTVPAIGQANEVSKRLGLGSQSVLSDSKIAWGLKEAFEIGATGAVNLTGKGDGYFSNQAIKGSTLRAECIANGGITCTG